jgi:hypothetical protein
MNGSHQWVVAASHAIDFPSECFLFGLHRQSVGEQFEDLGLTVNRVIGKCQQPVTKVANGEHPKRCSQVSGTAS